MDCEENVAKCNYWNHKNNLFLSNNTLKEGSRCLPLFFKSQKRKIWLWISLCRIISLHTCFSTRGGWNTLDLLNFWTWLTKWNLKKKDRLSKERNSYAGERKNWPFQFFGLRDGETVRHKHPEILLMNIYIYINGSF